MKKYFAYDALEREFTMHDTLEEAKSQAQDCVDQTFDLGDDDGFGDDLEDGIKETCFGVALGGFDLPTRPLTKEEEDIYGDQYTHMVENPVLVEYPQNNGWIKCSERLPPVNEDGESCSVLLYGMDILSDFGSHQFIGYLMEGKFYCDDGNSPHQCYYVSHWHPLPQPPEDE